MRNLSCLDNTEVMVLKVINQPPLVFYLLHHQENSPTDISVIKPETTGKDGCLKNGGNYVICHDILLTFIDVFVYTKNINDSSVLTWFKRHSDRLSVRFLYSEPGYKKLQIMKMFCTLKRTSSYYKVVAKLSRKLYAINADDIHLHYTAGGPPMYEKH